MAQLFVFEESIENHVVIDEKLFPEGIKRVFYIYGNEGGLRGGHRHKKSRHAMFCLNGSCDVYVHDGKTAQNFHLNAPTKCLILDPSDWREFEISDKNAIILVISSELYDADDYIYEGYDHA